MYKFKKQIEEIKILKTKNLIIKVLLFIVIENGEELKKGIFMIYQNILINFVGYF